MPTPLHTLMGHTKPVKSVKFSSDGSRIASAADAAQDVIIWHAQSGKRLLTLRTDKEFHGANDFAWSPDCRLVASSAADKTVRLWSADTGTQVTEPLLHENCVNSVRFSPLGDMLISGSRDGTIMMWKLSKEGGAIHTSRIRNCFKIQCQTFSVSPDFRYLVGTNMFPSSHDGVSTRNIQLWEMETGKNTEVTIELNLKKKEGGISSLAWSPDGRFLVVSGNSDSSRLRPNFACIVEVGEKVRATAGEIMCTNHVCIWMAHGLI